jgi:hypothetical protein
MRKKLLFFLKFRCILHIFSKFIFRLSQNRYYLHNLFFPSKRQINEAYSSIISLLICLQKVIIFMLYNKKPKYNVLFQLISDLDMVATSAHYILYYIGIQSFFDSPNILDIPNHI